MSTFAFGAQKVFSLLLQIEMTLQEIAFVVFEFLWGDF